MLPLLPSLPPSYNLVQDMLSRVRDQRPSHNNSSWITSSVSVSRAKLLYYKAFASMYGFMGDFSETVMVNSSWTRGHIAALWRRSSPSIVYPPCDTSELEVSENANAKIIMNLHNAQ